MVKLSFNHGKWIHRLFIAFVLTGKAAGADVRLPAVISDHAMLQAQKPVAIWGWADPGAQVKVVFVGDADSPPCYFSAVADAEGKWSGQLPKQKSGTYGHLDITTDKGGHQTVNDVLFGEVWLGGGQSNMYYDIGGKYGGDWKNPEEVAEIQQNIANAQKEADAAQPPIRYFFVLGGGADEPKDDVKGQWVLGDSKNVATFSAVAWNFAVTLQNKAHVPVGLIVSCVGGTPVQAWMSKETLAATSVGAGVMDRTEKSIAEGQLAQPKYDADLKAWMAANPTKELQSQNIKTKPKAPFSSKGYTMPVRLYNGMIHGLEPYTLRGIIWFQADGNNGWPLEYSELFQALIKEWRAEWKEELPFYFVEMNNMGVPQPKPVQGGALPFIREQQHGALRLPGVGMVAAIDVGTTNAHFPNKKPVGQRLAGLALRDCYGQPGQVDSPIFKSYAIEGNKVRLKFDHAEGLRVRGGGELKGFAIRGSTGGWVWATGMVEGQDIVVSSDKIPSPSAVRYAWAWNPVTSVENGAGLPLFPFRTDTESY
jgi:sialate O-acetylesterase